MNLTGNTIFVTGGGSGIGRGLAEALHRRGNQVIISGRRMQRLQEVIDANPGIVAIELDIADPASIRRAAEEVLARHPRLNVLINNTGIMLLDDAASLIDETLLVSTVTTNLLGPIRMTAALIGHLKSQEQATVIHMTSVLGFVPWAVASVYSATKAALRSYALSQRYLLRESGVAVLEIAPPWVRTELMNSSEEERAMPLDQFISGAMEGLGTEAEEILVGPAMQMRANPGPGEHAWVTEFNDLRAAGETLATDPALNDDLPEALKVVRTRPLFVMRLNVRKLQIVGATPGGFRRVGVVFGGSFAGERLDGKVLDGGNDWQVLRDDGALALDVRLVLQTTDGVMIGMVYRGLRHGPPETLERIEKGEAVDPSSYYFRMTPYFETASPKYGWLNRVVSVGTGHRQTDGPVYSIFEVL